MCVTLGLEKFEKGICNYNTTRIRLFRFWKSQKWLDYLARKASVQGEKTRRKQAIFIFDNNVFFELKTLDSSPFLEFGARFHIL